MKKYLTHKLGKDDPELISVIDELPLWSAPFGLKLLEMIKMKKNMKVLDVGCGLGFPLIEIAQRLGDSSTVFGIDLWEKALDRVSQKIKKYCLTNVRFIKGTAEEIPFDDSFFDLIVSNNGINNVEDMHRTIKECGRVCKPGGQFVFTMNLDKSMIEFYDIFEQVLLENNLEEEILKMKQHIHKKRRPVDEIKIALKESGFKINNMLFDKFYLRYIDANTFFNSYFIKYWFMDNWKQIVPQESLENIFDEVERKLNLFADKKGEIKLTIPYIVFECIKQAD